MPQYSEIPPEKDFLFLFLLLFFFFFCIFTVVGVQCRVVALKSLPVLHHSADDMFWSVGINGVIRRCSEYRLPLKDTVIFLNNWTPKIFVVITLKFELCGSTVE